MKILLISAFSSDELYSYIYNTRKEKHIDPAQKFFRNLVYGMKDASSSADITCISIPPVSASTHDKLAWHREETNQDEIKFIIPKFKNSKLLRFITQRRNTLLEVKRWLEQTKGEERIVICDPLISHVTAKAARLCKKSRCKTCAVVTDLPLQWLQMKMTRSGFASYVFNYVYSFFSERSLKFFDAYVWLTEQMNYLKNKKGKPYVIIEGFMDVNPASFATDDENQLTLPARYALYAGGVHKIFKINNLMEAFITANVPGTSLLIFGDGNDVDTVKKYSQEHASISYEGVVDSSRLAEIEKNAILLINPRPSNDEYTKYSFPSKTIEYMGSGTATLTTRLKGIPKEYENYLYWFEEEECDMAETLRRVLMQSDNDLRKFGNDAAEFIKKNKSAEAQASKIYSLISKIT